MAVATVVAIRAITLPPPPKKPALRLLESSCPSARLVVYRLYCASILSICPSISEVLASQGSGHGILSTFGGS